MCVVLFSSGRSGSCPRFYSPGFSTGNELSESADNEIEQGDQSSSDTATCYNSLLDFMSQKLTVSNSDCNAVTSNKQQ